MGNADFVPVRLARMSNGVLYPVQNNPFPAVMPAKGSVNAPCCTVTSTSEVCHADAKRVIEECNSTDVVRGILLQVVDSAVREVEGRQQECAVSDVLEREQVSDGRVLRSAVKPVTVTATVHRSESEVTPAKEDCEATDTVMPAKSGVSLMSELFDAFQEAFPDTQSDATLTQLRSAPDATATVSEKPRRVCRKRVVSKIVSASEDDVPLSKLRSVLQRSRHADRESVVCKTVSVSDEDDNDVPLAKLRSVSERPQRACRKCLVAKVVSSSDEDVPLAKLRSVSQPDVIDEEFMSDDDIPLSRMVKEKRKVKRTVRRSFNCQLCSAHFRTHQTIKGHLVKKHKRLPCRTTFCTQHFLTVSNRNAHEAVHTVKRFVCSVCKQIFKHKSVRDHHAVSHVQTEGFQCDQCEKKYHRAQDLKQHVKQHHRAKNAAKFHCPDCSLAFATARQLGYHRKIHLPKSILCPHCTARHCQQRKRHIMAEHSTQE